MGARQQKMLSLESRKVFAGHFFAFVAKLELSLGAAFTHWTFLPAASASAACASAKHFSHVI